MNRSPARFQMRTAALAALGLVLLLSAGDTLAQERRNSFQKGFRNQALGSVSNPSFAGQRANPRVEFRNRGGGRALRIAPLPQSSLAKKGGNGGGNKSAQFAPLPQTPPANNGRNGGRSGGGNKSAQFAPIPQTPPANNGRNGGGNGGGLKSVVPLPQTPPANNGRNSGRKGGGKSVQFAPLPQTPPANKGGKVGGRRSDPQFIVAPSAPPAGTNVVNTAPGKPVKQLVAGLAPGALESLASIETKAVQAEAPLAAAENTDVRTGAEPVEKPRGAAEDFVVKYDGTFYHVRRTIEDEYKVMGFLDKEFNYRTYVRPTVAPEKPRPSARRKIYTYGHDYIHPPVSGYGNSHGGY